MEDKKVEELEREEKKEKNRKETDEYIHYSKGMISYIDYGGLNIEEKNNKDQ